MHQDDIKRDVFAFMRKVPDQAAARKVMDRIFFDLLSIAGGFSPRLESAPILFPTVVSGASPSNLDMLVSTSIINPKNRLVPVKCSQTTRDFVQVQGRNTSPLASYRVAAVEGMDIGGFIGLLLLINVPL